MRVLLGSDKCCQSHLQTLACETGRVPLVGRAGIKMPVLWLGGGQVSSMLLVKRHREDGHMVLPQATRSEARGPAYMSGTTAAMLV